MINPHFVEFAAKERQQGLLEEAGRLRRSRSRHARVSPLQAIWQLDAPRRLHPSGWRRGPDWQEDEATLPPVA